MSTKRADRRFGLLNNCFVFDGAVFLVRLPAQKRKIVHSWRASQRDSRDSGAGIVGSSTARSSTRIFDTLAADSRRHIRKVVALVMAAGGCGGCGLMASFKSFACCRASVGCLTVSKSESLWTRVKHNLPLDQNITTKTKKIPAASKMTSPR